MSKKIVRHIPTNTCYYTEDDGITVIICGANLVPEIDGKIWEYVDEYIENIPVAVDPYAAAIAIRKERGDEA